MEIAELKKRVRIEDLLRFYRANTPRFKAAGWVEMRCPFHDDQEASASVNLVRNVFRCHACDVGGDIINIVKHVEGFHTVREAMLWIEMRLL